MCYSGRIRDVIIEFKYSDRRIVRLFVGDTDTVVIVD